MARANPYVEPDELESFSDTDEEYPDEDDGRQDVSASVPARILSLFVRPDGGMIPLGSVRYRAAYGGRGSGKSFSFALMAAIFGMIHCLRILCTREFQNSIQQSFYAEVKSAINAHPWLSGHYDVGEKYIRGRNGTEFLFAGLSKSMGAIKSTAQINLCIVEEAEDIPERSWVDLIPTIRADGSEIWVIWNPKKDGSPVDKRFRKHPHPESLAVEVNYHDNPRFPAVLAREMAHDREVLPPALFNHIWDGAYLEATELQIFADCYTIAEFEPGKFWKGPYYGLDFGFSVSATAAVEIWFEGDTMYYYREAGKVKLELDKTAEYIEKRIPGFCKGRVMADKARPETINYLKRHGIPRIEGADKWPGCVEERITWMQSCRNIVIHPQCEETAKEHSLYSYKPDPLTGKPTEVIIDKFNHYIDAGGYAVTPIIRRANGVRSRL